MILSDREIRILLEQGRISISPIPSSSAWSSTALDLSLAPKLHRWKIIDPDPSIGFTLPQFCPGTPGYDLRKVIENHTVEESFSVDSPFILARGQFVLAWTVERVRFPIHSRVAARVEGKSSLARIGLGIHVTAPTIHAGFGASVRSGTTDRPEQGLPIQLEVWNIGPLPIALIPGMKICQLIFEEVHGTPDTGYAGQFAAQGPTPD